jgi:hypothetical protein
MSCAGCTTPGVTLHVGTDTLNPLVLPGASLHKGAAQLRRVRIHLPWAGMGGCDAREWRRAACAGAWHDCGAGGRARLSRRPHAQPRRALDARSRRRERALTIRVLPSERERSAVWLFSFRNSIARRGRGAWRSGLFSLPDTFQRKQCFMKLSLSSTAACQPPRVNRRVSTAACQPPYGCQPPRQPACQPPSTG